MHSLICREYTYSFTAFPKNKMATMTGSPELAFEKGYYEIKQQVRKVPAQDTDTSQKRCSEHLGQCESSIPATDNTAYGVPLIRQKVTLGPGMGPNTVAKINVWVYRGNSASLHP